MRLLKLRRRPIMAMPGADLLVPALARMRLAPLHECMVAAVSVEALKNLLQPRMVETLKQRCDDLPAMQEVMLLSSIANALGGSKCHRTRVLPVAVTQYVEWLATEGHYEVGLAYLEAARRAIPHMPPAPLGEILFLEGRINRMLARWEVALAAFDALERVGQTTQLRSLELRAHLGRGMVARYRGNLPEALAIFNAVAIAADLPALRAIKGHGYNNAGLIHELGGRLMDAAKCYVRAAQLYDNGCDDQVTTMGNLASVLLELRQFTDCDYALQWVRGRARRREVQLHVDILTMALCAARDDETGFRCWLGAIDHQYADMLPATKVDFHYRTGQGFGRLGCIAKARAYLTMAMHHATAHQLHEAEFKIEGALHELVEPREIPTYPEQDYCDVSWGLMHVGN